MTSCGCGCGGCGYGSGYGGPSSEPEKPVPLNMELRYRIPGIIAFILAVTLMYLGTTYGSNFITSQPDSNSVGKLIFAIYFGLAVILLLVSLIFTLFRLEKADDGVVVIHF